MVLTNNCNLGFQIETFNPETCTWNTFVKRLKNKFVLYDTPPKKQSLALLDCIRSDVFEQLCCLCQPREPETMTFDELVNLLSALFQSVTSKFVERCKFHNRVQREKETFRDFANDLMKLALRCKFPSNWFHEGLITQFIVGVKSAELQSKFYDTKFDVFEDLVDFASKFESAFHHDNDVPSTVSGESVSKTKQSEVLDGVNNENEPTVTDNAPSEENNSVDTCIPSESQLIKETQSDAVQMLLPEIQLNQYHFQLFENDFENMDQHNEESTNNVSHLHHSSSDVDLTKAFASEEVTKCATTEKPKVSNSLEKTKTVEKSKSKKIKTSKKKTQIKSSKPDASDPIKKSSILRSPKFKVPVHFENIGEGNSQTTGLLTTVKRTNENCQLLENAEVRDQKRRKVASKILRSGQNDNSEVTNDKRDEIKEPQSTHNEMPSGADEEKPTSTVPAKKKRRKAKNIEAIATRKSSRDASKVQTLNPTCLAKNSESASTNPLESNGENSEIELEVPVSTSDSDINESSTSGHSQLIETISSKKIQLSLPYVSNEKEETFSANSKKLKKSNISSTKLTTCRSNAGEDHIWQGSLKWLDKMDPENVTTKQIRCTITIEAKENAPKLALSKWPKILRMELKPATQSIPLDGSHRIDGTFKASFAPEKNRSLNFLMNAMKTGLTACIEVQLSSDTKIVTVVHYFRSQETFVGYINICIRQPVENIKETESLGETESNANETDTADAGVNEEILPNSDGLKKRRRREVKEPEPEVVNHMERRKRRLNPSWLSNGLRKDYVFNI